MLRRPSTSTTWTSASDSDTEDKFGLKKEEIVDGGAGHKRSRNEDLDRFKTKEEEEVEAKTSVQSESPHIKVEKAGGRATERCLKRARRVY